MNIAEKYFQNQMSQPDFRSAYLEEKSKLNIEEDYQDYFDAVEIKRRNQIWIRHDDLKKELGF
jgi:hypothetical protein